MRERSRAFLPGRSPDPTARGRGAQPKGGRGHIAAVIAVRLLFPVVEVVGRVEELHVGRMIELYFDHVVRTENPEILIEMIHVLPRRRRTGSFNSHASGPDGA